MPNPLITSATAMAVAAVAVGFLSAGSRSPSPAPGSPDPGGIAGDIATCPGTPGQSVGPDVIVGDLPDTMKYGTVGGISAYAIGTTSCNLGSAPVLWVSGTPAHPVIGQHLFRLKDGRFEQVGLSWLKHGFLALSGSVCCPCMGPGGSQLGVGCSDPYSAGLNGSQNNLGPRHQVNAATGAFTYPWSATVPAAAATIGRRLQVRVDDLDPALNPGAIYFAEGHYVTADDAAAGNDNNNASYRRINVGTFTSGSWTISFSPSFQTQRQKAAIEAWKDSDAAVTLAHADVPSDGRVILASKVSDNGDGTWHYEYAVQNLNSHRSGGSFSIPVPAGVAVTNIGFHDVDHHSGDGFGTSPATPVTYDGTDWSAVVTKDAVTWSTTPFDISQNANALRWGTLYNFRFDADSPPVAADAALGLWRPGTPTAIAIAAQGPSAAKTDPADLNGDGQVDGFDLGLLLGQWGKCKSPAPGGCPADLTGDGAVDGKDLAALLGAWG